MGISVCNSSKKVNSIDIELEKQREKDQKYFNQKKKIKKEENAKIQWEISSNFRRSIGNGCTYCQTCSRGSGTAITLDINETLGQEVANEIGNKCEFFHADVTNPDSWNDLEKYLGDRFNKVT